MRIGKFYVGEQFFQGVLSGKDYVSGLNLFKGLIILAAQQEMHHNRIVYWAACAQFDDVPQGDEAPEYEAVFLKDATAPVWVRKQV